MAFIAKREDKIRQLCNAGLFITYLAVRRKIT